MPSLELAVNGCHGKMSMPHQQSAADGKTAYEHASFQELNILPEVNVWLNCLKIPTSTTRKVKTGMGIQKGVSN